MLSARRRARCTAGRPSDARHSRIVGSAMQASQGATKGRATADWKGLSGGFAPRGEGGPCADCGRGDAMGRGRRRHGTATAGYRLSRVERGPAYRAESGSSMRPLPASLLDALRDEEEVLVTSRDARTGRQGTVPMWFAVGPPGVVYLFTLAYSRKAERWRRDPWVRLTTPGKGESAEGVVHVLGADEIDAVAPLAVERWDMA